MVGFGTITKLAFPVKAIADLAVEKGKEAVKEELRDDRIDALLEHLSFQRRPQLSSELLVGTLVNVNDKNHLAFKLLEAETTLIKHKLGRVYQGWHEVWKDVNSVIFEDVADDADRAIFLPLKCSADVNIRLLVF